MDIGNSGAANMMNGNNSLSEDVAETACLMLEHFSPRWVMGDDYNVSHEHALIQLI